MRELPILMKQFLVEEAIDGRKTQTRRMVNFPDGAWAHNISKIECVENQWWCLERFMDTEIQYQIKPKYQVGDVLWAKETFYQFGYWINHGKTKTGKQRRTFCPNPEYPTILYSDNVPKFKKMSEKTDGWYKRSPLFMEKSMSRFQARVTDVSIQRIQDISEEDAIAEGITVAPSSMDYPQLSAQDAFQVLWMSINGEETWKENVWVWVYKFEKI